MNFELKYFKTEDFHAALRTFFQNLNIPIDTISEESVRPQDILEKTYKKDHPAHQLMEDVYFLGMVDDAAFEGNAGLGLEKIESDYDGILIFGVTLNQRENGLLPTRSQLAEITRSFNREFCYTPVVVVFKYEGKDKSYIAFANAERLKYEQEWLEGEKTGKVSLLRDIDLDNPHSGHLQILLELAISRSGKKAINTFADLYIYWQTVFNVSLLNKKFYEELFNWYCWAIKEVTFPSQPTLNDVIKETGKKDNQRLEELIHEHNAKNVIRLLTRFLFVWFIKEKNLIPEEIFNLEYLKNEILNDFSPYHMEDEGTLFKLIHTEGYYYKAILQNLFFATLNQEIGKRGFRNDGQHRNTTNLLRYETHFKNSQKFVDLVESVVPFMNGGLFECLDNPHPTKKGSKNAVKEWGMPENELDSKLHQMLSFDPGNPFADNQTLQNKIIKALDHCTILDPACGSGAFPMGILQKMVHILQKVDPENKSWQELQMEKALKETESVFQLVDKETRKQKLIEINEAFDTQINDPDYARKLFLIENCIYGVDIQPIATQISKLRFFISLVVDQKVDKNKANFGIRPLPNLETKFVAANTLIGIEKPKGQLSLSRIDDSIEKLTKELKAVRHKIFSAKTPSTKRKLREKDCSLRKSMGEQLIMDGWDNNISFQLAGWDPYDQNASSTFFDPEWMFGIKDGFDVVIGNPPYMRIQGIQNNDPKLAQYYKETFKTATGRFDLYCLFTEKSINLLKNNGLLNFIMPFKWINSSFGKGLRRLSSDNKQIKKLISFKDFQVFNASTYTSLVWFGKQENDNLEYCELNKDLENNDALNSWLKNLSSSSFASINISNLGSENWNLADSNTLEIHKLMARQPLVLTNVVHGIFQGIVTGDNDVFVLKNCKPAGSKEISCFSDSLQAEVLIEDKILKPILTGNTINRYGNTSDNTCLLYPYHSVNGKTKIYYEKTLKEKFPKAYNYLIRQKDRLANRGSENMKYPKWYSLWNYRSIQKQRSKKILTPDVCYLPQMWFDENGNYFHMDTSYALILREQFLKDELSFYLLLNSLITWYYLVSVGTVLRGGFFRFKTTYLNKFPVPKKFPSCFISIAKMRMIADNSTCNYLDEVINGLVFQLYFPIHMQEKQIDIMQFVEKDLVEVMQAREFEQLPDSEKENIVNQLHARWSHPDSEVRNRIKLFAVRSPEILKPILESR